MKSSIKQRPVEKVLLIFPPVTIPRIYDKMCCFPMGIGYLGAVLREFYEVRLLDTVVEGYEKEEDLGNGFFRYGLDPGAVMDRVMAWEPDVVGLSCLFSNQFPVVAELCRRIKAWNPEVVTVTGGTHPTFLPRRCLKEETLDYIVMGEAEDSLPALLRALHKGKAREEVDGLAWRENGEIIVFNTTASRILGLPVEQVLGRTTSDVAGLFGAGKTRWSFLF